MLENGCRSKETDTIRQEVVNHFQLVLGSNMRDLANDGYHMDGFV